MLHRILMYMINDHIMVYLMINFIIIDGIHLEVNFINLVYIYSKTRFVVLVDIYNILQYKK